MSASVRSASPRTRACVSHSPLAGRDSLGSSHDLLGVADVRVLAALVALLGGGNAGLERGAVAARLAARLLGDLLQRRRLVLGAVRLRGERLVQRSASARVVRRSAARLRGSSWQLESQQHTAAAQMACKQPQCRAESGSATSLALAPCASLRCCRKHLLSLLACSLLTHATRTLLPSGASSCRSRLSVLPWATSSKSEPAVASSTRGLPVPLRSPWPAPWPWSSWPWPPAFLDGGAVR
ncbi:hypothetical protein FA09DRAFT_2893 [Tilletiopsis washingtonensis]|uniref:Uncharacterized protein n=1 Tax=Tilletiopsis washingtonensis TaxID=58919 RepID=A0A316ZH89_9BASI|nr:hypothetical protein FA09DRAFT_2893 [Tilletiopsis washingtonensis]PWO01138.1 hypothetical protein FA09DRAFT_2893 [Tilletiopsis washingtonensis]